MIEITDIIGRIRAKRKIDGISAVLLPFLENGKPDLATLEALLERTWNTGLQPAVNMDTGYVNLLTRPERSDVLRSTQRVAAKRSFVAGAFIEDEAGPGDGIDKVIGLYRAAAAEILEAGGTPILFQCRALKQMGSTDIVRVYATVARGLPAVLAFELGEMFADFGRIYSMEVVKGLLEIPELKGMKHSSLSRRQEWQRLAVRDVQRTDFKIYTGNDLAIDMVIFGSDYLLGLSAFAPDHFARRDRMWERGDPEFFQLNDVLQYLGSFAFRAPVPAYKHSAAQFLKLRGWIPEARTHPRAPQRPQTDTVILENILHRLENLA